MTKESDGVFEINEMNWFQLLKSQYNLIKSFISNLKFQQSLVFVVRHDSVLQIRGSDDNM